MPKVWRCILPISLLSILPPLPLNHCRGGGSGGLVWSPECRGGSPSGVVGVWLILSHWWRWRGSGGLWCGVSGSGWLYLFPFIRTEVSRWVYSISWLSVWRGGCLALPLPLVAVWWVSGSLVEVCRGLAVRCGSGSISWLWVWLSIRAEVSRVSKGWRLPGASIRFRGGVAVSILCRGCVAHPLPLVAVAWLSGSGVEVWRSIRFRGGLQSVEGVEVSRCILPISLLYLFHPCRGVEVSELSKVWRCGSPEWRGGSPSGVVGGSLIRSHWWQWRGSGGLWLYLFHLSEVWRWRSLSVRLSSVPRSGGRSGVVEVSRLGRVGLLLGLVGVYLFRSHCLPWWRSGGLFVAVGVWLFHHCRGLPVEVWRCGLL